MTTATPRTTPTKTGIYNLPLNFAIIHICSVRLSFSEVAQTKYVTPAVNSKRKCKKISRCRSRSSKYAELGHFTLLFCRGRQRNVQSFITNVPSRCFAH